MGGLCSSIWLHAAVCEEKGAALNSVVIAYDESSENAVVQKVTEYLELACCGYFKRGAL